MKVIVCLKMMRVEQYEQLNVGGKRVIEIYDKSDNILIKQATKRGYIECENGGVADLSYPSSKTRRGRVQECGTICPTITATETGVRKIDKITNKENHIIDSPVVDKTQYRIRKLTPKECWRLMGFSDDAFEKAKNAGISNTQLYKQAGNSIVTHVLYYIYVELYKAMPYLFNDLKVGSYFSGIGAFETALDMLYENENANNFYIPKINFQDSQT
jgi:DNA (cytosine-5)-methyltransferase 1